MTRREQSPNLAKVAALEGGDGRQHPIVLVDHVLGARERDRIDVVAQIVEDGRRHVAERVHSRVMHRDRRHRRSALRPSLVVARRLEASGGAGVAHDESHLGDGQRDRPMPHRPAIEQQRMVFDPERARVLVHETAVDPDVFVLAALCETRDGQSLDIRRHTIGERERRRELEGGGAR